MAKITIILTQNITAVVKKKHPIYIVFAMVFHSELVDLLIRSCQINEFNTLRLQIPCRLALNFLLQCAPLTSLLIAFERNCVVLLHAVLQIYR